VRGKLTQEAKVSHRREMFALKEFVERKMLLFDLQILYTFVERAFVYSFLHHAFASTLT
jgi:hypothetical protein